MEQRAEPPRPPLPWGSRPVSPVAPTGCPASGCRCGGRAQRTAGVRAACLSWLTSGVCPWLPRGQGAGLLWAPRPPPPHPHELHGLSIPITFPHHLAGLSGAPSAPGGPGTQRWARRPVSCFLWSSGCHHQQARLTECSDLWQVPMPGRGAGAGAQAWELRPGRQPGAGPSPSMPSGVRGPHQMREWPRLCPSCPDPRPFAQAAPDPGHSPHALPAWPLHVEDSSANAGWCVTTSGQNGRHEDMSQSGSLLSGRGAPDGGGGWLGFRGEGCGVGRQVAAPGPPPARVSGSWGNAARSSSSALCMRMRDRGAPQLPTRLAPPHHAPPRHAPRWAACRPLAAASSAAQWAGSSSRRGHCSPNVHPACSFAASEPPSTRPGTPHSAEPSSPGAACARDGETEARFCVFARACSGVSTRPPSPALSSGE